MAPLMPEILARPKLRAAKVPRKDSDLADHVVLHPVGRRSLGQGA
jgi:hypothetical protein